MDLGFKNCSVTKWWDVFRKARAGDTHLQIVCARYSRMLEGAKAQERADRVYDEELVREPHLC